MSELLPGEVLHIPFSVTFEEVCSRIKLSERFQPLTEVENLFNQARALINLKACYERARVNLRPDNLAEIFNLTFSSRRLAALLKEASEVMPFIVTVGPAIETEAVLMEDNFKQYILEEIANLALERSIDWLSNQLKKKLGMSYMSSITPGCLDDWPVEETAKIFSFFGGRLSPAGVRLTEDYYMLPRKSLCGILFQSENEYIACRVCERRQCLSRRVVFEGESSIM